MGDPGYSNIFEYFQIDDVPVKAKTADIRTNTDHIGPNNREK